MIQELLKSAEFTDTLRTIAQKRRQGILEVKNSTSNSRIYFVAGRIVDFDTEDCSASQDMLARLQLAGYIPEIDNIQASSYQELYDEVVKQKYEHVNNAEYFRILVEERILDRIHSLELTTPDSFFFTAKILANVDQFNPRISIGQYLLDLVALDELQLSLADILANNSTYKLTSLAQPSMPQLKLLFSRFQNPKNINELRISSGLSRFHFYECFQALVKERLVQIVEAGVEQETSTYKNSTVDTTEKNDNPQIILQTNIDDDWDEIELKQEVSNQIEQCINKTEKVIAEVKNASAVRPTETLAVDTLKELPSDLPVNTIAKRNWKTINADLLQSSNVVNYTLTLFILIGIFLVLTRWPIFFQGFNG